MKALMAVFWKELADDFTSRRFLILFPLVFLAAVSAAYVAAQGLKPVYGSEEEVEVIRFVFLKVFTVSSGALPSSISICQRGKTSRTWEKKKQLKLLKYLTDQSNTEPEGLNAFFVVNQALRQAVGVLEVKIEIKIIKNVLMNGVSQVQLKRTAPCRPAGMDSLYS